MRWRLLLLTPWFVPGLAGGGITVSVRRMVEQLEADYDISVITRWHSDTQPAIRPDAWQPFGKCSRVVWLSRADAWRGHRWIGTWHPDIVHVHGLYDPFVHVLSLRLRSRLFAARWVLSPHGMLDPGALAVRRLKKRLFLFAFRQTGPPRQVLSRKSAKPFSFCLSANGTRTRPDLSRLGRARSGPHPAAFSARASAHRTPDPRAAAGRLDGHTCTR